MGDNTFQVTLRIPLFQGSSDYGFQHTYTILITREDNGEGTRDSGQDSTGESEPGDASDDTLHVLDKAPKTGDYQNVFVNAALFLAAAATLFAVAISLPQLLFTPRQ